ncbi:MAG: lamin tail domain-containing protein [Candidatus Paceibacterota bacterium]
MKYAKFLILTSLIFCTKSALASLEITEIMFDPKGSNADHQWIEVYNPDGNAVSVDAGTWRFNDGSGHYMNDKIDFSIPASSYVIITGNKSVFLADHPGYSGTVIDTSMSLDKDGDIVALTNNGATIISATYTSSMGASENGDSLQKINGTWKGSSPTPGTSNVDTGTAVQNIASTTVEEEQDEEEKILTYATKIISPTRVTTNIAFPISVKTTTSQKEILNVGRFVWNFGDGNSETRETSEAFEYMYAYPGEYVVTLSFYRSIFSETAEAKDRIVVTVLPAGVRISATGDSASPYVELQNNSGADVDISKWILKGATRSFVIPEGSIVLPSKKVRLASRATGFDSSDIQSVILQSPTGEIFSEFPVVRLSQPSTYSVSKLSQASAYTTESTSLDSRRSSTSKNVVNLNDLGASAIGARATDISVAKSFWPWFGLVGSIGIGVTAIVLLGRRKNIQNNIEDEIRAEDMTIIE